MLIGNEMFLQIVVQNIVIVRRFREFRIQRRGCQGGWWKTVFCVSPMSTCLFSRSFMMRALLVVQKSGIGPWKVATDIDNVIVEVGVLVLRKVLSK